MIVYPQSSTSLAKNCLGEYLLVWSCRLVTCSHVRYLNTNWNLRYEGNMFLFSTKSVWLRNSARLELSEVIPVEARDREWEFTHEKCPSCQPVVIVNVPYTQYTLTGRHVHVHIHRMSFTHVIEQSHKM